MTSVFWGLTAIMEKTSRIDHKTYVSNVSNILGSAGETPFVFKVDRGNATPTEGRDMDKL